MASLEGLSMLSRENTFPFLRDLPDHLRRNFSALPCNVQKILSEQADRYATGVMHNVSDEFVDLCILNPHIPAMDELPWAILKQKLIKAGCEVAQTPETDTGWSVRLNPIRQSA